MIDYYEQTIICTDSVNSVNKGNKIGSIKSISCGLIMHSCVYFSDYKDKPLVYLKLNISMAYCFPNKLQMYSK